MRLSSTLSVYITRQFLVGIVAVLALLLVLVTIIDTVELLRRASGHPAATAGIMIQLALLRVPHMALKIIPFAVLFGGILTLTRLTRTHELVVARAAGVSVWQFLLPGMALALLIGAFTVAVFTPLASATTWRYEQLEAKYLRGRSTLLAVPSSGLWLREDGRDGQVVVHAERVAAKDMTLDDVIIFLYKGADRFSRRIDARTAKLKAGYWELEDALISVPDERSVFLPHYRLETGLTLARIQESFASPETLSFWDLPSFIRTLEKAGFSARNHRLYWQSMLATPVLLLAMVLIAATFSLRLTRRGGTGVLVLFGLTAGFLLYFMTDMLLALGRSASIPVALAAWTPAGVSTLLGLAMLFHLEDG